MPVPIVETNNVISHPDDGCPLQVGEGTFFYDRSLVKLAKLGLQEHIISEMTYTLRLPLRIHPKRLF